jgi:hypothetical protein
MYTYVDVLVICIYVDILIYLYKHVIMKPISLHANYDISTVKIPSHKATNIHTICLKGRYDGAYL